MTTSPDPAVPDSVESLFDFKKEQGLIDKLISGFKEEVEKTNARRELRQNKVNVLEKRAAGELLEDETFIPDRTIDLNIRRGATQYVQYVTKSKRLLVMTDVNEPVRDLGVAELWFTRGMRYPRWTVEWMRGIDSMSLHGGAAMEVRYDPTKPHNCAIEFIPRESLIVPLRTKNLQACPHILRAYQITSIQIEEFATSYGFDEKALVDIRRAFSDNEVNIFRTIYRGFCKKKGIVYAYWYSQDYLNGYLREPRVYDIGLFDFPSGGEYEAFAAAALDPSWELARFNEIPTEGAAASLRYPSFALKEYPITWYPYSITEEEHILSEQGRASLDLHVQEALSHLLSATINAATRAAGIYPSAKQEPGQDPKLLTIGRVKPGNVMNRELSFWQPPWPNSIILAVIQALDVRKANESGNMNFAAMARKDANKTATEMNLGAEAANEEAGVKLETFSSSFLSTYALCYLIARHQAIMLLCPRPADPTQLFGNITLQPAGDIEIVKRNEDKQNAQEFFRIIQGTPAAEKLLIFLLTKFFPDQADEWINALQAADKDSLIATMTQILETIPRDELSPEQSKQLDDIIGVARTMVSAPGNPAVPSQSS